MRPKFSANVIEAPDCSSVNFAGPQMSTCPPATNVNRAFPSCTVSTLPLNTKLGAPGVAAAGELSAVVPLSTETSFPSTRPIAPGGACCPRETCAPASKAANARNSAATFLGLKQRALYAANCGREHIGTSASFRPILYRSGYRREINRSRSRREFAVRSARPATFALAPHANPHDSLVGLWCNPPDRSHAAPRRRRRAQRSADRTRRRSWHRSFLASLHFFRCMGVAQSRHGSDEHGELRWPVDAPRDRASGFWHRARQLEPRRNRRPQRDGAAHHGREARGVYD